MERNIVPTDINYTYSILKDNLNTLKTVYPFIEVFSIGESILGKELYTVQLGNGPNQIYLSASIHANEWITSVVLMKFLEDFLFSLKNGSNLIGFNINEIYNNTSIYITPMLNPDGVDLVTGQMDSNSRLYHYIKGLTGTIPFPEGWKANILGTDLNLNFPAGWEEAREIKYSQGFTGPSPRDYVGPSPLSEPESVALYNFTLSRNFKLVVAYHTQGQEIYWQFRDYSPPRAREIGEKLANASGYRLADTPYASSFAGYKDWFIQEYNRPGYTVEAGLGQNPLPISQFDEIYKDNLPLILTALSV